MTTSLETAPRHPIGVVSRRTGLKPDLIRAWERRYKAVQPSRSETRRRLYSDADIERLRMLCRAVRGGRSIGYVASLDPEELAKLIAEDGAAESLTDATPQEQKPSTTSKDGYLEACVQAIASLDTGKLETLLERASVIYSRIDLIENLMTPLMHRIGDLWQSGKMRPIHEHMASSVLRSFVGNMRRAYHTHSHAPRMLVSTPAGQVHEMGSLVVAACAATEGWEVIYLGSDLPAEELAAGARQKNVRAVALSITYPPDDPDLADELRKLRRLLDPGVSILVGGRSSDAYLDTIQEISAYHLGDLSELRAELVALRTPL